MSEHQQTDLVNHPPHYISHPSGVECIKITEHMNFCLGNAMKYLWRADLKNDAIEDLEKAAWYIQREIARRKGAPAWAAQAASADHKISPAPTRSPMNSIAPVPAHTVSADAVPAPLTSFEDTTHAWEEGYRAGVSNIGKINNAPSGDLISREAVLKFFQPETSILRKRICDDIRALPAAPIGKEIWSGMRPDMIKRAIEGV